MPILTSNLLSLSAYNVSPNLDTNNLYTIINTLENKPPFGIQGGPHLLPLPKEMDGAGVFTMDWQQESLGGDFLNNLLTRMTSASENAEGGTVGHYLSETLENMGAGGAVNAKLRDLGTAKNPINNLLFKTPNLRQFQFTWDFVPVDAGKAQEVKNLIKDLRTKMHPTFGGAGYITPNAFSVEIHAFGNLLFKSAASALTSLTVNPYGSGVASFHGDGQPVHTILTLEFQELGGLTQKDIQALYGS